MKNLLASLLGVLCLVSGASAQYAASASGSTTAAGEINSKPAFQLVAGAPTSLSCTAGKDFAFNTSASTWHICTVSGAPGTWAQIESAMTFSTGLSRSGAAVTCVTANGSTLGCLSAADWTTFNAKEVPITFSTGLSRTVNAVACNTASGSSFGCLTAADWTTFNSKVSMVYPGAGVPNSTGSAWGTSYTVGTAANNLLQLNSSGNLAIPGSFASGVGGSAAGFYQMGQGTAPSLGTNAVTLYVPTSVTSYGLRLPGAAGTGFLLLTNTSNDMVATIVGSSGSGSICLTVSCVMTTPDIGAATATSVNKVAITAPASSATLTIANGKALAANNSITLAGTDGTVMTFPSTSATIARTDAANTFTGTQTMTAALSTTSTAVTQSPSDNSTKPATTAYADAAAAAAQPVFTGSTADTVSSSATPAFSFSAQSNKSPMVRKFTPVVNVTGPTFTNLTAGARMLLYITTDGTWNWNSTIADNVCNVWTQSAGVTVAEVFVDPDGSTLHGGLCLGGPTGLLSLATEGSTCSINPAAGTLCVWADSTDHTLKVKDSSGNVYAAVKTASARTANQFCTHVSTAGVCVTAAIAAADLPTAILDSSVNYGGTASAGTDSYNCTLSPAPSGYVTGATYSFKADVANTGAASLNCNSLGAKTIVKVQGAITTTLADNDIRVGQVVVARYDGTNMQMVSQLGNATTGGTGCTASGGAGTIQASDGASGCQTATAVDLAAPTWVAGGGTAQAQTATYSPAVPSLTDGLRLCWKPTAANTAAAPTFAPNGLTARTIVKAGGTALVANDIITTAQACAVYNTTGTQWELQNPQSGSALPVNAQTGTSYTVLSTDRGYLVTLSNASSIAVTLPQATGSFGAGWFTRLKNIGAGTVTVTPTTSTISGAATITLETGEWALISSDGTNYEAHGNRTTAGSNVTLTKSRTGTQIAASSGGSSIDPTTTVSINDDFLCGNTTSGGIGCLGWHSTNAGFVGPPASVSGGATFSGAPGQVQLDTSTTSGTVTGMMLQGGVNLKAAETFTERWKVANITGTTPASNTTIRAGMFGSVSSFDSPTDGVYLEHLAADTNWFCVTRASSTETRTDTAVAFSASAVALQTRRVDASTIGCKVASTLAGIASATEVTNTTNIPTADLVVGVMVKNTAAARKDLNIDYFDFTVTGLSR